jgi:hypothetical protein
VRRRSETLLRLLAGDGGGYVPQPRAAKPPVDCCLNRLPCVRCLQLGAACTCYIAFRGHTAFTGAKKAWWNMMRARIDAISDENEARNFCVLAVAKARAAKRLGAATASRAVYDADDEERHAKREVLAVLLYIVSELDK